MLQLFLSTPTYVSPSGEILAPSTTKTLILPSPDEQNTLGVRLGTTIHITMSGDLWSYVRRPVPTSMIFIFNFLSIAKRIETDQFFQQVMGKVISMRDHNNVMWTGRISTASPTLTDQTLNNSSVSFEFEGYRA